MSSLPNHDANGNDREWLSQIDHELLRQDHLQLPRAACREIGPAAQTLGAIMRLCDIGGRNTTFASVGTIADIAMLPIGTVRRHILQCVAAGWLDTKGRQLLPGSKYLRRRTNTLSLTAKTINQRKPYGILPRWICRVLAKWSARALYAAVVARHVLIETVEQNRCGAAYNREEMSLNNIERETGLTDKSITEAKLTLERIGHVVVERVYSYPDSMTLNPEVGAWTDSLPDPPLARGNLSRSQADVIQMPYRKSEQYPTGNVSSTYRKSEQGVPEKCAPSLSKTPMENSYGNDRIQNTTAAADGAVFLGEDIKSSLSKAEGRKPEALGDCLNGLLTSCRIQGSTAEQRNTLSLVVRAVTEGKLPEGCFAGTLDAMRHTSKPISKPFVFFMKTLRHNTSKALLDLDQIIRDVETSGAA